MFHTGFMLEISAAGELLQDACLDWYCRRWSVRHNWNGENIHAACLRLVHVARCSLFTLISQHSRLCALKRFGHRDNYL